MSADFLKKVPLSSNDGRYAFWTGAFDTNSTSAPDGEDIGGINGLAVARSAAGTFTVTFPAGSRPEFLISGWAEVEGDNGDIDVDIVSYVGSTGVLTLKVNQRAYTAATAAGYNTGETVTTHVHTAATAGEIIYVESTAGSTTGVFSVLRTGTPNTTEVTVTYTSGVPTLTFAAADAVTECAYLQVKKASFSEAAADTNNKRIRLNCIFA